MRFTLLSQAVLVSLASFGLADNSCDDGPFASSSVGGPAFPGGNDPETNCDAHWSSGEVIIGIEAWSARFQVKAVRFKYSQSGWSPIRGTVPDGVPEQHQVKEWNAGDEVGISLWSNKPDDGNPIDAVGKIVITQGGNTIFEVGANSGKIQSNEIIVDNGAGLILAARTRSGAWLSSIEFKMLKAKVVSTELIDLAVTEDINQWNAKQQGINQVNLADVYFVNSNPVGGPNLTYSFTNSASRETSKKIVSQTTNQWTGGMKVTVGGKIGIPLLAEGSVSVEGSFQYQRTNMDGTETSDSDKKDLSIVIGTPGTSNLLPSQRAAHCQSWTFSGNFDSPYTGTIEAKLADGSTYKYTDTGDVTSVGWVNAAASCEEIDIKTVPSGAQIQDVKSKRAVSFRG